MEQIKKSAYFIIFMGVAGSGKTTIGKMTAETLDLPFYEGDGFHPRANVDKMSRGIPLTDQDRDGWLKNLVDLIHGQLTQGKSGILSCSALKNQYRDRLRLNSDQVYFIYLKGTYNLILKRMLQRTGHYMPAELLRSQFETLEEPEDIFTVHIDQSTEAMLGEILDHLNQTHLLETE
jgi:gluconokinase